LTAIYIDADACPVKKEIFAVAQKHSFKVYVVSNSWLRLPPDPLIEPVIVGNGLDAADNWIADHVMVNDITVTADIPLAARCLGKGARVIDPKGRIYTKESIGGLMATRNLMSYLREMGDITPGQPPYEKKDRSRFLQYFNQLIRTVLRESDTTAS
jgi:uncharacterized protein YaiI (UPF0178 family)